MELTVWIVLYVIAVVAGCIRLVFAFPEKANKPVFWIIAPIVIVVVGAVFYFVFRWLE